jgi:phosphomannomutase
MIKFGTSGWRGKLAEDFTFANLRLATQGIANHLKAELGRPDSPVYGRPPLVVIGCDTRFLGPQITKVVARQLAANGLTPLLCDQPAPTPVISYTIRRRKAIGGINITASHNPPEYQGLKFSPANGAPAPPEVTQAIEKEIARLAEAGWTPAPGPADLPKLKEFNPRPAYFNQVRRLIDLSALRKARLKVAVDLMYGAGRGYLDTLLLEAGAKIAAFHAESNPLFGGRRPEPDAEGLEEVAEFVRQGQAQLGLGLDGDADRFGIVDVDGTWLTPNQVLALAFYHLKKNRGWRGSVVRTVATSHQVDALARLYGVEVRETPVGFKYIGDLMEREPVIVGGEESGGLSIRGHVPEKDGIVACLLMAELVATERKPLGQVLRVIEGLTGQFHTERINLPVQKDSVQSLCEKLGSGLKTIGRFRVERLITLDGFKFLLPGDEWVAFRPSGTEPVFRCYIEAKSAAHFRQLRTACKALLK